MKKITPCLSFDGNGLEAAKFYVSIFKNSKVRKITRYGEAASKASGQKKGSVMTVTFTLDGQEFMALNGGPSGFSPAISLMAPAKTQKEVDRLWKRLSAGGKQLGCNWFQDKFGVTWQVVPAQLEKLIMTSPAKANRVMEAVMNQQKPDIQKLEEAYAEA